LGGDEREGNSASKVGLQMGIEFINARPRGWNTEVLGGRTVSPRGPDAKKKIDLAL